ncbi:MAG: acylneuraminate cytidylyltransferase [Acidobacteria bacterium]|nr:acylneuraminate cytidylyltransferase [Acidobacteriota bacterium]
MRGTAILLQARMGSSRLPGKSMRVLGGHTLVAHAIVRLQASGYPVVLTTTTKPEDDCLVATAEALGAHTFRGSELDVLDRYAQATRYFELHRVIRATADNPAVDTDAVARTLILLDRTGADHVVEHGLPYGAAVEAVRGDALLKAAAAATDPYDREHVTPFLRSSHDFFALAALAPGHLRRPGLRLTVDTDEDLAFMQKLLEAIGPDTFPAPLSAFIDVADRLTWVANGGTTKRGMR